MRSVCQPTLGLSSLSCLIASRRGNRQECTAMRFIPIPRLPAGAVAGVVHFLLSSMSSLHQGPPVALLTIYGIRSGVSI